MIVTFTGTQQGLTSRQAKALSKILRWIPTDTILMHGDCIGADETADHLAHHHNLTIHIYPCNIKNKRAFCRNADKIHRPDKPLNRNQRMVDRCSFVVAGPSTLYEKIRSGTWTTIRYARKQNKPIIILDP